MSGELYFQAVRTSCEYSPTRFPFSIAVLVVITSETVVLVSANTRSKRVESAPKWSNFLKALGGAAFGGLSRSARVESPESHNRPASPGALGFEGKSRVPPPVNFVKGMRFRGAEKVNQPQRLYKCSPRFGLYVLGQCIALQGFPGDFDFPGALLFPGLNSTQQGFAYGC